MKSTEIIVWKEVNMDFCLLILIFLWFCVLLLFLFICLFLRRKKEQKVGWVGRTLEEKTG